MKSETYLSAKITDDRVKVDINGPVGEVYELLEKAAVFIFKSFKKNGYSETIALFFLFYKNVAKEVFDIDLGRGYNQMIIDKYKELTKHGNS